MGIALTSRRTLLAAALVALVAAAALVVLLLPPSGKNNTTCAQCFGTEPIVDIVSPSLGSAGSSVNPNRTIDVQAGSSVVLEIDVYPTIAVNLTLEFSTFLAYPSSTAASSSGVLPTALFQPTTLSLGANGKGVSSATITVPGGSARGTYDSVFTAVNDQNSSEVWGLYFQLVVN